jgi:hypothetical protein
VHAGTASTPDDSPVAARSRNPIRVSVLFVRMMIVASFPARRSAVRGDTWCRRRAEVPSFGGFVVHSGGSAAAPGSRNDIEA